jgi:hypothetical protein
LGQVAVEPPKQRGTPDLSSLQQLYLGGMQSQQSSRALEPHACGGLMPQTSPSGSQTPPPVGIEQKPIGGLTPATITQVTRPWPGRPEPAAPQQSESL